MKDDNLIPRDEQNNVLSVFWIMLKEIESIGESNQDVYLKTITNGAYNLLGRMEYTKNWKRK